jgi:hypothetical protein
MWPEPIFVEINTHYIVWKKVAQKYGILFFIIEKLPKVNNRPLGENSPKVVTLAVSQHFGMQILW